MSLRWPEDEGQRVPTRRRPSRGVDPLLSVGAIFEPKAKTDRGKERMSMLPFLIAIVIVLALGAVLFLSGPLPTIFPKTGCNDCVPLIR